MAYAKISDYDRGIVLGCFTVDSGALHEYCERTEEAGDWAPDFPHLVCVADVINWPYRYAKVGKTVAYVITDENPDGSPLVEKWQMRRHRIYRKN